MPFFKLFQTLKYTQIHQNTLKLTYKHYFYTIKNNLSLPKKYTPLKTITGLIFCPKTAINLVLHLDNHSFKIQF